MAGNNGTIETEKAQASSRKGTSPQLTTQSARLKMLVIDDHPLVRRGLMETIREEFPRAQ